ncbi:MAG: DUF3048 domain-containing protein [Ilumatobacter sp.]|uniref:DUF3048 domain-containing protein n=1 Tax=Ilumatobacter sp. TaxID=1967498 RepID=UPI003C753F54
MIKTIAAFTTVALLAAACSGGSDATEDTTPTTDATTTTSTTTTTTTTEPPESTTTTTLVPGDDSIRQPLTGEVVESEDDLETRPALAVKIDNNARARPNHSGLGVADIVFEEIVEVGTRFAAVFHTEGSDPVGPIRSGREQDVNLLSSLNEPLFAWSGGNPGVTRLIRDSFLTDLNPSSAGAGAYYRGPGRAPHDFYSTTDDLYALTPEDHPGAPSQQFTYVRPDEEFEGREVSAFDLALDTNDVRWEWDDETGGFARFQEGTRHVDVVSGDIFATNVVVMVLDYVPSSIDRNSPDAQTLGSGPAYVFSNGQVQTGRWARDIAVGAIRLTDADGELIGLTPGNTWVELAEIGDDESFLLPPVPQPPVTDDGDAGEPVATDEPTTTEPPSTDEPAVTEPGPAVPQIDLDNPDLAPTSITIEFV